MAHYEIERAVRRFEFADAAGAGGRQNYLLSAVELAVEEERARWLDVRRAVKENAPDEEPGNANDLKKMLKDA